MSKTTDTAIPALLLGEAGGDPIEDRLRETVRATIEALFDEELAAYLGRIRYGRGGARKGYRHGRRERELVGTFGTETVSVPRARIEGEDGRTTEWRSKALPRYQRLTKRAEALIAAVYLAGTNTRRVKRALYGLFQGAVGKDVVSRAWRKVKVDWDAWCARSLAEEDIVRLILDGTVIRTRLDKKATNISVLAAVGVRRDGQKILLSIRHMGGESTSAWRQFLDDLDARGLKRPDVVIVDGAPGLEAALTALWGAELPIQRCTVGLLKNSKAADSIAQEVGSGAVRCWGCRSAGSLSSSSAARSGTSCPTITSSPASIVFSISAGCARRWPKRMPPTWGARA